jgi:predicted  nucleic acid-binding Zn-ribbon protein
MARNGEGGAGESGEVVLLVCLKCGEEASFDGAEEPPRGLECEKCGNQVFRRFDDDEDEDSRIDFRDSTDRDTQTDAGGGEVTRQDLMDLNNP